ncbi:MAG: ParG [Candidatus Poribacteria bacterium]|nr:ParG [Euryarchaeota archaeon]MDQ1329730.1 ParG [Candidatus Poribacteria bacterium]
MSKEKLYQANFGIPREIHKLFKLLAVKRGVAMRKMYKEACEQYLDEELLKQQKAELR